MVRILIGVVLIVFILTFIMFFLLKGIVKSVNQKAKNYFVSKMQNYGEEHDLIVDVKEEKEVEDLIVYLKDNNTSIKNQDFYNYLDKIPDYQISDFFKKYKEIDRRFSLNEENIIRNFIKTNLVDENKKYTELVNLREKFNSDTIYKYYLMDKNDVLSNLNKEFNSPKIVKEYLQIVDEFILEDFLNYLDNEIKKNDPSIYIEVGNKKVNYNYIDKNIVTIFNDDIYKGIRIIYKNKIYDYSLS